MDFDIRKFDQYRENNRLEVKRAAAGLPDSLWSTYSSMANSSGGVILLGVAEKNDGSFMTTGMKNAEKLFGLRQGRGAPVSPAGSVGA